MSKTVGLRDELYEKLEELATAQNVTVEQIIENLVREIESAHLTSAIERMRAKGILAPREQAPVMQFKRIKSTPGQLFSEMIIEERR